MADDPAKTVALELAKDICPGCSSYEHKISWRMFFRRKKAPCPFFHPDNFYYDSGIKRFWCHNWVDKEGNQKPPESSAKN